MSSHDFRIAKVQETLRRLEQDVPLLNLRVRELSKESQESARNFAAALISHTHAELERLLRQRTATKRIPQARESAGRKSD